MWMRMTWWARRRAPKHAEHASVGCPAQGRPAPHLRQQLLVRPRLDDPALVQNHDLWEE
jgi:hypothetical protein